MIFDAHLFNLFSCLPNGIVIIRRSDVGKKKIKEKVEEEEREGLVEEAVEDEEVKEEAVEEVIKEAEN